MIRFWCLFISGEALEYNSHNWTQWSFPRGQIWGRHTHYISYHTFSWRDPILFVQTWVLEAHCACAVWMVEPTISSCRISLSLYPYQYASSILYSSQVQFQVTQEPCRGCLEAVASLSRSLCRPKPKVWMDHLMQTRIVPQKGKRCFRDREFYQGPKRYRSCLFLFFESTTWMQK